MLGPYFRLGYVEPEGVNALVSIVFLELAPYKLSCFGIRNVYLCLPAVEIKESEIREWYG